MKIVGPAYPNATGATWGPNLDVERELFAMDRCTSLTMIQNPETCSSCFMPMRDSLAMGR